MATIRHHAASLAVILTTMVAPVATQSKPNDRLADVTLQPESGLAFLPGHRTIDDTEAIARLLASPLPHVRARAAILLRQKLNLPLPESTLTATNAAVILAEQTTEPRPKQRFLTMDLAQQAIDQLATHTAVPPVLNTDPSQLTRSQRQHIAEQLIEVSRNTALEHAAHSIIIRLPSRGMSPSHPDPSYGRRQTRPLTAAQLNTPTHGLTLDAVGPGPGGPAVGPRTPTAPGATRNLFGDLNDRALACLKRAMRIDAASCQSIVALALNTPCATTCQRALIALERECRRRPTLRLEPLPDSCAAMALTLLDAPSAETRRTATVILEHVLHQGSDQAVLAALHRRANARITRDIESLQLPYRQHYGCTGGTSLPRFADNPDTQLVLTSARLGNRKLTQPLLDQLREFPGRQDAHTTFLTRCLYWLAPVMTPLQAARMFQPLARFVQHRPNQLGRRTLFRLYAAVDDKLLPLLDRWHTGLASTEFWFAVESVAEHLTPERIDRLLAFKQRPNGALIAHAPERIRAAWLAGDRRKAVIMLVTACRSGQERLLPFLKTLPIALAAEGTIAGRNAHYPLDLLLHLHAHLRPENWLADGPRQAEHNAVQKRLYRRLAANIHTAVMQPEDLPKLAPFAADADHTLAIAAATRAYWLSEGGRDWCQDVLTNVCAREDIDAKLAALKEGVRLAVCPDNWRAAADELRKLDEPPGSRLVATAAYVRFDEQPSDVPITMRTQVLQLVKAHADSKTLRRLMTSGNDLEQLRSTTSAATMVAQLECAIAFPVWPQQLERRVLQATTDPFSSVRRAAYAALATRDRSESLGAWLAFEASLDPNESVRRVAPIK